MRIQKVYKVLNDYEKLCEKGNDWVKYFPSSVDGLTLVEREVIRILLRNNGELKSSVLIGELISKLVNEKASDLKVSLDLMLNQTYPFIRIDNSKSKNRFTREVISLSELGNMYYLSDHYYLRSYLPVYLLQLRIVPYGSNRLISLPLDLSGFILYFKSLLLTDTSNLCNLMLLLPTGSRIQKYNSNWVEILNHDGKYPLVIENSYNYSSFFKRLTLYNFPLGYDEFTFLDLIQEDFPCIERVENINGLVHIYFIDDKSQEDVDFILFRMGYTLSVEHCYYMLQDRIELELFSLSYLIEDWSNNLVDKDLVLNNLSVLESFLSPVSSDDILNFKQFYDCDIDKYVIYSKDGHLRVGDSELDYDLSLKYKFKADVEDIFLISDSRQIRINLNSLDRSLANLTENESRFNLLGILPCLSTLPGRVFYFISSDGSVKTVLEDKLYTRSSNVSSTVLDSDFNIVKILCNDEGSNRGNILFLTRKGFIKVLHVSNLKPKNRSSKFVNGLVLEDGDEVIASYLLKEDFINIDLFVSGSNEQHLSFSEHDIVKSKLHRGILIKGIDFVDDFVILNKDIISDNIFI